MISSTLSSPIAQDRKTAPARRAPVEPISMHFTIMNYPMDCSKKPYDPPQPSTTKRPPVPNYPYKVPLESNQQIKKPSDSGAKLTARIRECSKPIAYPLPVLKLEKKEPFSVTLVHSAAAKPRNFTIIDYPYVSEEEKKRRAEKKRKEEEERKRKEEEERKKKEEEERKKREEAERKKREEAERKRREEEERKRREEEEEERKRREEEEERRKQEEEQKRGCCVVL